MNGTKLKSHLGQSEIGIKGAIESISGRLQNLKENQRKEAECLKYFIEVQINPQAYRKIDFENSFEKFGSVQETV
mgnify:CR=1 FL=1